MGAIRNYKIAKEYLKYFEQVSVVTPKDKNSWPKGESLDLSGFDIHEVGSFCLHSLIGKFPDTIKFNSKRRQSRWSNLFRKVVRSFPFNLILNGGGLKYIFDGYKKGVQLIENEEIDYIQTSFPPMTDQVIGWLLKRKFPHLTWIADFRDLVVEDRRNDIVLPELQHWFIKKLVSKADVVTTVSTGLEDHISTYKKSVEILRNGIPNESSHKSDLIAQKFTISYTGSIYKNLQTPQLLFDAISALIKEGKLSKEKIQFLYRGKDIHLWQELIKQNGLSEIFNGMPSQVSIKESRVLQHSSHINLLLSWASKDFKGILTGKMYDYMAAGKPVALIVNGEKDEEFEWIFEETNLGEIFYHPSKELESMKTFIMQYYQEWLTTGDVKPITNQKGLEDFRIENIIENFVENVLKIKPSKTKLTPLKNQSSSKIAS